MKRGILWLCFLLLPVYAQAIDFGLEWDHPGGVDGYSIHYKDFQKPYGNPETDVPLWVGPELTCNVTVPDDRLTAVVARAWVWGLYDLQGNRMKVYSDPTNEVVLTPPLPEKPPAPGNLFIRVIVAIAKAISYFFV